MIVLGIVILIIIIAVAFYVAEEFRSIAAEKGYDDKKYFWCTFWLFPIGAAMVIALPNKKNFDRLIVALGSTATSQSINKEAIDELPEL